jgi:hypothetical protein
MRVEPEHADAERFVRRPRGLQARDETRHRRARREEADREPALALVLLDDVCVVPK